MLRWEQGGALRRGEAEMTSPQTTILKATVEKDHHTKISGEVGGGQNTHFFFLINQTVVEHSNV